MSRYNPRSLAIFGLGAVYLFQALSPMRLDNDSVVYLHMATSMTDGVPRETTGLPIGYPALISLLERMGLGMSFFFVIANCAFIAIGLMSLSYLFDKRPDGLQSWVVPLTLLSVPLIRFIAMHLPETMFFGISLLAVALMTAATRNVGRRRAAFLGAAVVLTAAAITVRLVGFALVPPLLWACTHREDHERSQRRVWTRREKWIAATAVFAIGIVALVLLGDSFRKYAYEAGLRYLDPRVTYYMYAKMIGFIERIGEVAVNLPATQLRWLRWEFVGVGLAAIFWVATRVQLRTPRSPAAIYLITFLVLLFLWPYNASRLWLPIVPLFIGYAERATLRSEPGRRWQRFVKVYRAWFVFTGLLALAYTTRITLSGPDFSRVYGKGGGMALPNPKTGEINEKHNQRVRVLKRRFDNPYYLSLPIMTESSR